MGKFNKTLSHRRENSDKIAMIARQAPARVRACSHGGGGPQVGEVPHLPGVRKNRPSHATPGRWGEV